MVTLSKASTSILTQMNATQRSLDKAQASLVSGKEVASVLDAPSNFFVSQSLSSHAVDVSQTIDGFSTSLRTIQEANNGLEAIMKLLDDAKGLVATALEELFPATDEEVDQRAIDYIIGLNGDKGYFPTLGNFYQQTADFDTWANARVNAASLTLNGVPEIGGHLATITSQEENDVVFNLLTATSWLGGSDAAVEGEWRWTEGPEAGDQFWQGLAGGSAVNGAYNNWAPGEPNQFFGPGNPENYAHMRVDGRWNDLPDDGRQLNYIIEWGGDLFVPNPDVNVSSAAMDMRDRYLDIIGQINDIAEDSHYRGVGLLNNDHLKTALNVDKDNHLIAEGIDATREGLGLTNDNFVSKTELSKMFVYIENARKTVRDYAASLQTDASIIQSRKTYAEQSENNHISGSNDLVLADVNEKAAEIQTLQLRQNLQTNMLSLSNNSNILDILFRDIV